MKLKWICKLFNALASALILVSVLILLMVVLTPSGQIPQILGFSVLRVMTGSMEPAIPVDTMLLVRQVDPEEIVPGDVITFFSPDPSLDGAPITHRVQRVEQRDGNPCFITKGDANALEDREPVSGERLVGKVIFASAGLGLLIRLLSNPLIFGGLILLPLLAILLMNLYRTVRLAADLARQEEETAIRQALEDLKAKNASGTAGQHSNGEISPQQSAAEEQSMDFDTDIP